MKILFNRKKVLGAMYNATTHDTTVRVTPTRISCRTISVLPRNNPKNTDTPPKVIIDFPVEVIREWISNHENETYLPIFVSENNIMLL
jgi:hypothetical protein